MIVVYHKITYGCVVIVDAIEKKKKGIHSPQLCAYLQRDWSQMQMHDVKMISCQGNVTTVYTPNTDSP